MLKTLDLRKPDQYGPPSYTTTKFPDGSLKITLAPYIAKAEEVLIITSLRSNDDIIMLGLVKNILDYYSIPVHLKIHYMMYQQDDRMFAPTESFGLKVIANYINSLNFRTVAIFHPHSDKVEMIDRCRIVDNSGFLSWFYSADSKINHRNDVWVIPDQGAYKSQFKLIKQLNDQQYVTCLKDRDHRTGDIITTVQTDDLQGKDCFIVDDICLGGRTFIQIAEKLREKNCGKLYLVVSHGVFNNGINHLLAHFDCIYTTDSICTLPQSDKLRIFNL